MSTHTLAIGVDNLVEVSGLVLATDGTTYVNDATVTFTLTDEDHVEITDATDVAMAYVAASNGKYQGTLPYTVTANLTKGASYWLFIEGVKAGRTVLYERHDCVANYAGS